MQDRRADLHFFDIFCRLMHLLTYTIAAMCGDDRGSPAPCDRCSIWHAKGSSKRPEGVPHCPQPARQPANQQTRHKQPQPRRTTLQAGGGAHPRPDEGRRNRPSRRSQEQGQHHQQGGRASPHAPREHQNQREQPHQEQHQARGARRRQPEPDTPRRQQANQQGEQAHRQQEHRRQANQGTNHHHRPRDAHAHRQREHHSHGGEPTTGGRKSSTGSAGWRTEFDGAQQEDHRPGNQALKASEAASRKRQHHATGGRGTDPGRGAVRPTRASVGAARAERCSPGRIGRGAEPRRRRASVVILSRSGRPL